MTAKRIIRISTTVVIILFVLGIILYPKIKPMFSNGGDDGSMQPGMRGGRGNQILFASGYVIVPTQFTEMKLLYSRAIFNAPVLNG